jgi:hypothetical protein
MVEAAVIYEFVKDFIVQLLKTAVALPKIKSVVPSI